MPRVDNLQKVDDYFNVSVEHFQKRRGEKMKRDEMLEIVSELLTVLYSKNVTLMQAESIAYMFNERVKKEIAVTGECYKRTGTFKKAPR